MIIWCCQRRIKDVCARVCVLSILGARDDSYRLALLGACLDNLMSSHFHGRHSRLILQKPPMIHTHLLLLWIQRPKHNSSSSSVDTSDRLLTGKRRLQTSFRVSIRLNIFNPLEGGCCANSSVLSSTWMLAYMTENGKKRKEKKPSSFPRQLNGFMEQTSDRSGDH